MGTVLGMPISGLLAQWFGWESVFYFFGGNSSCCRIGIFVDSLDFAHMRLFSVVFFKYFVSTIFTV